MRIELRDTERGKVRDGYGQIHYALSNAPAETSLERLARGKCQSVFIEVAYREAKTEDVSGLGISTDADLPGDLVHH